MKVLTWNLNCEGNYKERLPHIIELVRSENPDIIAFQEVLYGSYDLIISAFEGYYYYLDHKVKYNRLYGELILTKFEILEASYVPYGRSPNIRGITCYKHNDFWVITTHLENKDNHNNNNTKELINYIQSRQIKNFVLLGDFNYYTHEGKLDYNQVNTEPTYREYDSRPDRVYFNNFEVESCKVVETDLSDHYPIVSIFIC